MKIAPCPAYFLYDGFNTDLDAAMVYERLMDCQHPSPMLTHALTFLRSCMIGGWRQADTKLYVEQHTFFAMLPQKARQWGAQRFNNMFPSLMAPVVAQIPMPLPPIGNNPPGTPPDAPPRQTANGPLYHLDESLPSLSGMGIGCVQARVFPCEPIFRKPAGEVYLCSNWSDVYLILRLAPI